MAFLFRIFKEIDVRRRHIDVHRNQNDARQRLIDVRQPDNDVHQKNNDVILLMMLERGQAMPAPCCQVRCDAIRTTASICFDRVF